MPKLCVRCGKNKAEVPDNTRMGRPILRVCRECHMVGLMSRFVESYMSMVKQQEDVLTQKDDE